MSSDSTVNGHVTAYVTNMHVCMFLTYLDGVQ